MTIRVGIISFAHMHAHSYAESLAAIPSAELVGIYDDNRDRGEASAAEFHTKYYSDLDAFLRTPELDAVIVCSENAKHKEHVMAAAEAKKHILCEKPIATNVPDAEAMIAACEKAGVKLQIAFPVRFAPPMMRMKQLLRENKLGRILAARGTNHGSNPGGWFVDPVLSGGGAVLDHTVHIIDILRWFLQSEVTEVYAEVDTRFSNIQTDDCGLLLLQFENGVIASHDPSWSRARSFPTWGDVTLKLVGTEGVAEVDALAQHYNGYYDANKQYQHHFWGDGYDMGLVRDFLGAIEDNREASITGVDGLRAMEVALGAYESARLKQPVKLRSQWKEMV